MNLRTLRIIIVTFVSHLLLAPLAFTSQAPPPAGAETGAAQPSQEVTIRARQQEKRGDIYTLDGDVEILFQNYVLRADHGTYNEATGEVQGSGRLIFDGGPHDAHLVASHAVYNVKDETGIFYDVSGTFGAVVRGNNVVLTTSNPFVIAGSEVRKVGPDRYIVSHGSITSCAEQTPKWTFNASKIDLEAGDDAKLYHSSFRLMKLPIFYFPYNQLPASGMARTSGFLLPTIGDSTTKGFIMGESVYWAIDRSNDLTLGAEYYSSRGWSQTVHFRSKPGEKSSIELRYFGVMDHGVTVQANGVPVHLDQGGEEARALAETTRDDWRASASVDYLSSFLFRQAWSETYSQAIDAEVKSEAYLSHNRDGFSLNASAERYQDFYQNPLTNTFSSQIKIVHLPMAEANALERPLLGSPLFWAVDASAGGLQRSEPGAAPGLPGFSTANLVGRLDIRPRVALPLQWNGWDLRPEIAVEDTLYTQQLIPAPLLLANPLGMAGGNSINRRDVEASIELRPPVLEKVFGREIFGRKLKHVIQPIFTYNYTTGISDFQHILRFDQTDIRTNTSEFQYDLIQRIYGRRRSTHQEPGCEANNPAAQRPEKLPPAYIPGVSALRPRCEDNANTTRELLSWEVKQKYYFNENFGGALVFGRRNVFTTTDDLSGIAFLNGQPRAWSPVISKLRVQTSANTDVQWQLDYDPVLGRINSSATFVEYRTGEYFFGVSDSFFRTIPVPASESTGNAPLTYNQIRYLIGYGHPNKRGFSGGFSMGYDQNISFLQYVAVQSSYNWDCCGLSLEYRHIDIPGVNVENQYRFAFTLANIGSAGNMRRQERLY